MLQVDCLRYYKVLAQIHCPFEIESFISQWSEVLAADNSQLRSSLRIGLRSQRRVAAWTMVMLCPLPEVQFASNDLTLWWYRGLAQLP